MAILSVLSDNVTVFWPNLSILNQSMLLERSVPVSARAVAIDLKLRIAFGYRIHGLARNLLVVAVSTATTAA